MFVRDVFKGYLTPEIVFKFSLKTDFYGDIRRNYATITQKGTAILFLKNFFGLAAWHAGSQLLNQGSNPDPQQ